MKDLDLSQKIALCSAIRTSRYSRSVVSLLRDMADSLYKKDSMLNNLISEMTNDEELYNVLKDIFKNINTENPVEAESIFRIVIDYLKSVEEINFTVPVYPSKEFVKRLYNWCSENIRPEILIEFNTNRLMESGFLMVYKGHYFEYSLSNFLDEYFNTHPMNKYLDAIN